MCPEVNFWGQREQQAQIVFAEAKPFNLYPNWLYVPDSDNGTSSPERLLF